jgi:predicted ATPase
MKIESVSIHNFKSIEMLEDLPLGQITLLVGPNNSGKSALIQALYSFQDGGPGLIASRRVGTSDNSVTIRVSQMANNPWNMPYEADAFATIQRIEPEGRPTVIINSNQHTKRIPAVEPAAFFYPQLGKRKVVQYNRTVDRQSATTVAANWQFLVSRLQRLANQDYPGSSAYRQACEEILGFVVTVYPSDGGQQAGRYVDSNTAIPLEEMGEGVSSIVSMLVDLATARDKLILIEEPENDLHPQALKALLRLMVQSAAHNQFVVTTHSNIVLRYLGAHRESQVIRVDSDPKSLPPTSSFEVVSSTTADRLTLLRELGYELADFDLYEAWLILEESSAERLIREYFLKWFAPTMVGKLRTVSARGTSRVNATFEDLSRLFLYAHLEPVYQERAWVLVDGDDTGKDAVSQLRKQFGATWPSVHFQTLSRSDFEEYYPKRFEDQVNEALDVPHGSRRQDAKAALLRDVAGWIDRDELQARREFELSAFEIVEFLRMIEKAVGSPGRRP